jgi:hypothetical protein
MIRIFTDFAPSPVVVAKVRRLERRRELVVQGPGTAGKSDDCAISHCIDGTVSVQIAAQCDPLERPQHGGSRRHLLE